MHDTTTTTDPVDDYATAEALARAAGAPTAETLAPVVAAIARMACTAAEATQALADHLATGEPLRHVSPYPGPEPYTGAELSVRRITGAQIPGTQATAPPEMRYAVVGIGRADSAHPLTLADLREWLAACESAGVPESAIPTMGDPDGEIGTAPAWLYAVRVTG